jgi:proteasome lid subunit RPN8/RPN11
MLTIAASLLERIKAHAVEAYPAECNGLIVGEYPAFAVRAVCPARNAHDGDTRHRYRIDPAEHLRVEREARAYGGSVIGVYHSHPDNPPSPSAYDREHAWPGYLYVIVSVRDGTADQLRCWTLREDGTDFDETTLDVVASD